MSCVFQQWKLNLTCCSFRFSSKNQKITQLVGIIFLSQCPVAQLSTALSCCCATLRGLCKLGRGTQIIKYDVMAKIELANHSRSSFWILVTTFISVPLTPFQEYSLPTQVSSCFYMFTSIALLLLSIPTRWDCRSCKWFGTNSIAATTAKGIVASAVLLQESLVVASSLSAAESRTDENPERIIPETLPVVHVYDHCPFSVRVRMALGLKNVKHSLYFMANDDVKTPTDLVGKKIAPILQWEDIIMPESLDIVRYLDQDDRLGPTGMIAPFTGRQDLKVWQIGVKDLLRNLLTPRYVATGLLPEFQQMDSRLFYIKKRALPRFSKEEWDLMSTEEQVKHYEDFLVRPAAAEEIAELNRQLVVLNNSIYCREYCSEGGLSYDDIDLFPRLRFITLIKGVEWPAKLRSYIDYFSVRADIPLFDGMAI